MKKFYLPALLATALITFSGCEAIGDIFKAGMWTGILAVIILVAAVLYFVRRK